MLGLLSVSEDGSQSLIIVPSPDDPSVLLVYAEWLGIEHPPHPIPLEALQGMLEAINEKPKA